MSEGGEGRVRGIRTEGGSGDVVPAWRRWWQRIVVAMDVDADAVCQADSGIRGYADGEGLRDESGEADEKREYWRHRCGWVSRNVVVG